MNEELKSQLKLALHKVERVTQEVIQEQGYTPESERLKLLEEIIREQVINEGINNTAG